MPGVGDLAARLRGCPVDCAYWAGDAVTYRDRHADPWRPQGRVVGPSDLPRDAWPPAADASGEDILRAAISAVVGTQARVLVDWRGTPEAGIVNMSRAHLCHVGPCPPLFTPGTLARLTGFVLGDLKVGDLVRVTGIAASGILSIQAVDGRHGEAYRSQLQTVRADQRAP